MKKLSRYFTSVVLFDFKAEISLFSASSLFQGAYWKTYRVFLTLIIEKREFRYFSHILRRCCMLLNGAGGYMTVIRFTTRNTNNTCQLYYITTIAFYTS